MSMFNDVSCDGKDNEKNAWQMLKFSPYLQGSLVLDSGHLLVPVLRKSGTPSKRTVHKEFGITSRKRYCWNSQKADVPFSVQQLHFPRGSSKAKDTENCLYILLRIKNQLRPFFAELFLPISSVFTEPVANMCDECEAPHDRSG